MLRKSMVALAVLAAMNAQQANALGLGEVKVHSALNQPLNAEINLLQVRDLAESQIIAGLADADDFYLAGVKPTTMLSDISFQLDVKNGKGTIKLSTSQPIREPFLNFLVEVNWPSGRLVREYTVLLDPPVFSPKDLNPRSAPALPQTSAALPSVRSEPMRPMAAPLPSQTVTPSIADGKYRVGKKDTLWDISLKTRPDRSISPQQMMMALQRMNPDAFVNDNINRLKSGVVLSIPNKQQILAYDSSAAVAEVKRQNSAWKGAASPKPKASAAPRAEQMDAAKSDQPAAPASNEDEKSQLRIVSKAPEPENESAATEDKMLSADAPEEESPESRISEELLAKNQELEEQLVVTLEGLDKVERDNAELFDRLEKLTGQLESMQQLLMLKDQQMSDLQSKMAEEAIAPPPPPPEKGFLDTLMASPAIIGGVIAALLAALLALFLIGRKRRAKDDDEAVEQAMAVLDERDQTDKVDATAAAATVAAAAVATAAVAEESKEDEVLLEEPESTPAADDDPFDMSDEDLGDFDSLISDDDKDTDAADLDMDLEIDEPIEEDPEMAEFAASLMDGDEFDISTDADSSENVDALEDSLGIDEIDLDEEPATDDLDLDLSETDLDNLMDEALGEDDNAGLDASLEALDDDADLDFVIADDDAENEADADISDDLDALLAESDDIEDDIVETAGLESTETDLADVDAEDVGLEIDSDLDDLLAETSELVEELPEAEDSVLDIASADEAVDIDSDLDALLAEVDEPESRLDDAAVENAVVDDIVTDDAVADDFSVDDAAVDAPVVDEAVVDSAVVDTALETEGLEELVSDEAVSEDAASVEIDETVGLEAELSLEEELDDLVIDDASASVETVDMSSGLDDLEALEEIDGPESLADLADELPVLDAAAQEELDELSDADLESELDMALADEANALDIEETDLVEEEGELDYLEGADELGTKLDLARAYVDMDDLEGAREILQEVVNAGDEQQATEAQELLDTLS